MLAEGGGRGGWCLPGVLLPCHLGGGRVFLLVAVLGLECCVIADGLGDVCAGVGVAVVDGGPCWQMRRAFRSWNLTPCRAAPASYSHWKTPRTGMDS